MKQYLDLLQRIKDEGVVKGDRTGTGTKSIFGHQMKFDLRDGFPMLTTKKLHLRSIIHELLWFLNGDTNNKYLKDNGVRIWNEWCDENQNLGKIYGYQFRKLYTIDYQKYEIVKKPEPYVDTYVEQEPDILEPQYENEDQFIGKIYTNNYGYEYIVIKREYVVEASILEPSTVFYQIQFIVSKSVKIVTLDEIESGTVNDDYALNVYHHGYFGEIASTPYKDTDFYNTVYLIWEDMLSRCYNPDAKHYEYYGAKNKYVCHRWLNFTNFFNDISMIYGYYEMMKSPEDNHLTLYIHGGDVFAPDRCMFISNDMENILMNSTPFYYNSELMMSLDIDHIHDFLPEANDCILNDDEFVRYKVKFVDQIQNCIDLIKNDPNSRRIMVCAWNPEDLDEMNLTPCHCLFQFYVAPDETGKPKWLDLQLYQRSCDTFLGVPFNIASYSMLCMMMAQVCGLEPRYFIHSMGDTHLYLNHLEQADIQLSREPRELPKMKLNPEIKDLFSFKYEDFELIDYNPHPHIKAAVSV